MAPRRIFLADSFPIVVGEWEKVFEKEEDFSVCGRAYNAQQLQDRIPDLKPDLLLLEHDMVYASNCDDFDVSFENHTGPDLIERIKQLVPKTQIFVLSELEEKDWALPCLAAGADGYLMKNAYPTEVIEGLRRISDGRLHVGEEVLNMLKQGAIDARPVTGRAVAKYMDKPRSYWFDESA